MAGEPATGARTTCARHRNVETYLRCGRCGTPICPKCLVHTPVGARCPDCARPTRIIRRGGTWAYLKGGAAGFGVGVVAGLLLPFLPGFLSILPILLMGLLVGEAVSAASNRRGGRSLAILAFCCAVLGPIVGQALLPAILMPLSGRSAILMVALAQFLDPIRMLFLLVAGLIASTRVDR